MGRYFGVEVECYAGHTNDHHRRTADILVAAGHAATSSLYHRAQAGSNTWLVKHDGSLNRGVGGLEVVSPKLKDQRGRDAAHAVVSLLAANNYTVNASCGLHVHVDTMDLSEEEKAAVFWRWTMFQTDVYDRIDESRRLSTYCRPLATAPRLIAWEILTGARFPSWISIDRAAGGKYHSARFTTNTFEFRLHHATLDADEVRNWIAFCVFFVNHTVETFRNMARTPVAQETVTTSPYRENTKNWMCLEAVRRGTTTRELMALTGWSQATISSMIADIRGRGIEVYRLGRGLDAQWSTNNTSARTPQWNIDRATLLGNIADGLPAQALAWLGINTSVAVAAE